MPEADFLPFNFMGLENPLGRYETSRFVVIPVAYGGTVSWGAGTTLGPAAIIQASRQVETFDVELERDISECGIHTFDELQPDARGPEYMIETIRSVVADVLADGKLPVVLGGEHTVSAGAVQAFAGVEGLTVLDLDAHLDMRAEYHKTPYSHACAARLIAQTAPVVPVGIRSACREEYDYAREQGVRMFMAREVIDRPGWIAEVVETLGPKVYVSVDLDVFDSSLMSAVGAPEPGGLFWRHVVDLLAEVARARTLVGFDVVELAPSPGHAACDFLAAKLVYRLMGLTGGTA